MDDGLTLIDSLPTNQRVLRHWEEYRTIPSNIDPEDYRELIDALEGNPRVPDSLLETLRSGHC